MKTRICSFLAITFLSGGWALAQEVRSTSEKYNFEVEASSQDHITASVTAAGDVAVWSDYSEKRDKQGKFMSFAAKKFRVYGKGKQVKATREAKDIPQYETAGIKRPTFADGITWMPSGGIEHDNKITFTGMSKIGFSKDSFVLGPFDYTISWATPLGLDKSGHLYLTAECAKAKSVPAKSQQDWRVFHMLYKVDKNGQLIDSFVYDEAKYAEKTGMGARYPWVWDNGTVHADETGNFYLVNTSTGAGPRKISVKRWGTR